MSRLPTALVAVDGGPQDTLRPIADHCGASLAEVPFEIAESDGYWSGQISARSPRLLVVGTSDSVRGRSVESAARRAARTARIPLVAIEDFPGNYYEVEGGEANLLVVESSLARDLNMEKFGGRCPRIEVFSPARYDAYRNSHARLRRETAELWRRSKRVSRKPRVLWAGQPETLDSLRTLQALLPALRALEVELLLKAHPRDPGHAGGVYQQLLQASSVPFEDVTATNVCDALSRAPQLVVTQFSSVAIEAGFFGIPSLWVLLPDAGGRSLRNKKGYDVPLLCKAGGAAMASHEVAVGGELKKALQDRAHRDELIRCFDAYFQVHELSVRKLVACLKTLPPSGR
ncbi:MAG: hypothetical protein FJY54_12685 [Betaproteobacteria bacterium]|nr:hypothetical protein [Betaproteobacteria bacterium]